MKVVSVSRRTDIPAFYSRWFMNRVRAGFACSRNPFNPNQISTVSLQPDKVACLVFWTKDPRSLLPHVPELEDRGQRSLFHVTVTALPHALEPRVPAPEIVCEALRHLAQRVGPQRIIWRFDPVVLGESYSPEQALARFERIAADLSGAVATVKISFLQRYRQVIRRLRGHAGIADLDGGGPGAVPPAVVATARALSAAAQKHGLTIESCAERFDLTSCGIAPGRCLDPALLGRLFGLRLDSRKDPGQRPECGCMRSVDLGVYGTCRHGCRYCYAATDRALKGAVHDPQSPLLFGHPPKDSDQSALF